MGWRASSTTCHGTRSLHTRGRGQESLRTFGPAQAVAAVTSYVAAGTPPLGPPQLAANDAFTHSLLARKRGREEKERKKEKADKVEAAKEEEKMRALNTTVSAGLLLTDAEWAVWYRLSRAPS